MQEFSTFPTVGIGLRVEYSPLVLEELRQKAVEASVALRRTGIGIGGLLLGSQLPDGTVQVVGLEEIDCVHALGPSFALTEDERRQLRTRLAQPGALAAVGLYVSKPRGDLELTPNQVALFDELFPGSEQFVLLIRPGTLEPSRFVMLRREDGLLVKGEEFDHSPLRASGRASGAVRAIRPASEPSFAERMIPLPEAASPTHVSTETLERPAGHHLASFTPVPITVRMVRDSISEAQVDASGEKLPVPVGAPTSEVAEMHAARVPRAPEPTSEHAAEPAPVIPIRVEFDESAELPRPSTARSRISAGIERRVFIPIRRNLKRLAGISAIVVLVSASAAAVYLSRPFWVTPPPANLRIEDKNGTATLRWDPESAEFVDAGTISVLENGETKTVALSRGDLMRGWIVYNRTGKRIVATLALDERRFIAAFDEPQPRSSVSQNPAAPAVPRR